MKFLLGMVLSVACALALSSSSFAGSKFYFGNGQSIDAEGKRSNFLISLTIKKVGMNKKLYSYDIQHADHSEHFDLYRVRSYTNKRFFDIKMSGDDGYMDVGHGYCWRHKCHVNVVTPHVSFEHTHKLKHHGKVMYGIGSKLDAEGNLVYIWNETMKLLN